MIDRSLATSIRWNFGEEMASRRDSRLTNPWQDTNERILFR
jgi:hypothetical protein